MNNYNKTGSDTGVYFDQGHQMVFPHWHQIPNTDIEQSKGRKVCSFPLKHHQFWEMQGRCIFTITQWNTCFHVYCVTCVIIYVHSCWSFRFISVSRSLASITFKWWFPHNLRRKTFLTFNSNISKFLKLYFLLEKCILRWEFTFKWWWW